MVEPLDLVAAAVLAVYAITAYRFRFRSMMGFLATLVGLTLTALIAAVGQGTIATAAGLVSFVLLTCSVAHALWEYRQVTGKKADQEPGSPD